MIIYDQANILLNRKSSFTESKYNMNVAQDKLNFIEISSYSLKFNSIFHLIILHLIYLHLMNTNNKYF